MAIQVFPSIPFVDGFANIIAKAQQGRQLTDAALCSLSGLRGPTLEKLLEGKGDRESIRAVCLALDLHSESVLELINPNPKVQTIRRVEGLAMFSSPYDGFNVNSYTCWDPITKVGFIVDTGGDADEMLTFIRSNKIRVEAVLLTHTHMDHVLSLEDILEDHAVPVYVSEFGFQDGWKPFPPDHTFNFGSLEVSCRHTWGHSACATSYLVKGLDRPVAFVGDALFARSIGAAPGTYREALENIRIQLLSLPSETILLPGHGPVTTVGQERDYNPFFPESKAGRDTSKPLPLS